MTSIVFVSQVESVILEDINFAAATSYYKRYFIHKAHPFRHNYTVTLEAHFHAHHHRT